MPLNQTTTNKTLTIYTPNTSGFFFSDLLSQLTQLCNIKQYRVSIIQTGSLGTYNERFGVDNLDLVVILRNAVHNEFAQMLRNRKIPTVCVSHEYLPLDIPTVGSNNLYGVAVAIDYLIGLGHKHLRFAGTLDSYDVRKRYEAFCSHAELKGFEITEDCIYDIPDYNLNGGYVAARKLIEQDVNNVGIVCGTALNSLGVSRYLRKNDPERLNSVTAVGFDAITLIPALEPNVATVDQNFTLIAHKVLSTLEKIDADEKVGLKHQVQPKLITKDLDEYESKNAYLVTSPELNELENPNYINAALTMISEAANAISEQNIDNIMSIEPMFTPLLERAILSRTTVSASGQEFIKYSKVVDSDTATTMDRSDKSSIFKIEQFPQKYSEFDPSPYAFSLHLKICKFGENWGYLSLFGQHRQPENPCSLKLLFAYCDWILGQLESKLKTRNAKPASSSQQENTASATSGKIEWNASESTTRWHTDALAAIGFESELEIKVYEYMDIFDRIHDDDIVKIQPFIHNLGSEPASVQVRFKNKNRTYVECELTFNGQKTGDYFQLSLHVLEQEA